MENITKRQAQILAAIVKDYSQSSNPVGSEELREKFRLAISPATIRNEMKVLETAGFIMQPHTSAGRVPTDKGYRYFINKLMGHLQMSAVEQQRLRQELLRFQRQYLELGRSITKLLSERSEGAAFAMLPESTSTSGLAKVIDENTDQKELKGMADFLDKMEEHGKALMKHEIRAVETFIGHESPVPLGRDFSLMVTQVQLPSGEKGVIGIVGTKRMKYARNISLLEYLSKLVSGGLGAYLIIANFKF